MSSSNMPTAFSFLFLMDPYPTLNLETETSLALMTELLSRGHRVYWLEESDLYLDVGKPRGHVAEVTNVQPLVTGKRTDLPLETFSALLVRKDPPFDQQYLHLTLILDHLPPAMMQFNSVNALRNFNEKLLPLRWPELAPPTLVTANPAVIKDFIREHQVAVLKPLDDCSGRGVKRIQYDGETESRVNNYLTSLSGPSPYVIAQRFLPEVAKGDKRVYLVNGEPVGWVNRIPQPNNYLANIHRGAICEATSLSWAEKAAITRMAPFLVREGIFLAGIDFIGDYLTEVNITSPSAIRQINQAMNDRIEVKLVDGMLESLTLRLAA